MSGRVDSRSTSPEKKALIFFDGQVLDTVPVNDDGYFHLDIGPGILSAGDHTLTVEADLGGGARLLSEPRKLQYQRTGPWVRITPFAPGDYVTNRPYLAGEAGWFDEGTGAAAAETGQKTAQDTRAERKVRAVEVSMDNGSSFKKADGKESWRYRLETQGLANGDLRLLVKAVFENGDTAVTRTQLTVDTKAPDVTLLEPSEGGRFNQAVQLMGTASDDSGLKEVAVTLREGDKASYEVPGFIQGLYLDVHALGATYWDAGMGLTFFSDAVKLQLQVGMAPPGRFSGLVLGAKLLANVATLPFGYLFGPDWDFFSMSLAVGANFSYFTMSENIVDFSAPGLVLGGIIGQIEVAKIRIASLRFANTYSLYTEYQLWFISSDVQAGTAGRLGFGLRVGLL